MNYRVLGRILGLALVTEAALMVPSMLIGLYHGESILGFSTTIGILLIVLGIWAFTDPDLALTGMVVASLNEMKKNKLKV